MSDGRTDNQATGGEVIKGAFGGKAKSGGGGPSPERMASFERNDFGNAMRLILLAGGTIDEDTGDVGITNSRLLYLLGSGWIGFNGRFWDRECGEDEARKMAHRTARLIRSLYPQFVDMQSVPPKDFWKFADQAGGTGGTSGMLRQAQSYLSVRIDVFDRDELAINCRNGTLKMAFDAARPAGQRFGRRLMPHDPADRITRMAAVDYDGEAEAPLFKMVLDTALPDQGDGSAKDAGRLEREFFQRWLGYSATGRTEEQAFTMTQGRGRDGKSTLLDACRETLGTYGWSCSPATFLEGGMRSGSEASPDLVALSGDTRFVVLSEPPRGSKLNEGLLKAWTGGAPIPVRDLHGKPFNFRPRGKLNFECNAFPVAKGDDDGIWRRIITPQFRHQMPKDEVDRLLPKKLRGDHPYPGEMPGILNWMIAGVGDWLERGSLDIPDALEAVKEDYRKSSSPFGDWLRERCFTGDDAKGDRALTGDLYRNFKEWFEAQGFEKPMSARAFGDAMRDRQIGVMGKNAAGLKYRGPIRLKTAEELASEGVTERDAAPAGHGDPLDPDAAWRAAEAGDLDGSPFG